ncbi:MAG: hypothetical protein J7521_21670 [Caulobacter sp.]|nr:hypothetical protein [Caulobacter sp.]
MPAASLTRIVAPPAARAGWLDLLEAGLRMMLVAIAPVSAAIFLLKTF